MNPLLIISPHLDDAVLSCGARIAAEADKGRTVIVATCFTSPGEEASEDLQQLYQQRRSDDRQALQSLGAEYRHLDFIDAPFRDPQYHNFNTILFHHRLPEEEQVLVRQLTITLAYLIEEIKPHELLFPLGTGGHIDHHIVWECSKACWDKSASLSFYEDLPYALLPRWSDVRRQQLQHPAPSSGTLSQASPSRIASPPTSPDLAAVPLPWIRNYLTTPGDLHLSQEKLNKEYAHLPPDVHNVSTWMPGDNIFIRSLHETSIDHFDKKCQAITHYTTEWPVLFGPDENNISVMLNLPVEEAIWTLKRNT